MTDKEESIFLASDRFKSQLTDEIISQTWTLGLPVVFFEENGDVIKVWPNKRIAVIKSPSLKCAKKVRFLTEKDAQYSLDKITRVSDRKKKPVRAYYCDCGGWHLTSKPDNKIREVSFDDLLVNLKDKFNVIQLENSTLKTAVQTLNKAVESLIREGKRKLESDPKIKTLLAENNKLKRENARLLNEVKLKTLMAIMRKIKTNEATLNDYEKYERLLEGVFEKKEIFDCLKKVGINSYKELISERQESGKNIVENQFSPITSKKKLAERFTIPDLLGFGETVCFRLLGKKVVDL